MKLDKSKKIIAGLGALLVVVVFIQYLVLGKLENLVPPSKVTEKKLIKHPEQWDESWKVASKASTETELDKAETLLKETLKVAEKAGNKDSRLAAVLNCLARVYEKQGKYSEAEPLYQRVLEIDQTVLGKEHKAVIADLDNLANSLIKQKKYKEAEELFKKAVVLDEKLYGKDHPRTAADLSYLVLLYDIQGNSAEAEKQCKRALEINEKAFGQKNPIVAANYHSLALIKSRQGKFEEAESYLINAQDIWRQSSSINDPKLAASLENTALLQKVFESEYIEGKPDAAVQFPQEAFDKAIELRREKKFVEAEKVLKDNLERARKSAVGTPKLAMYLVRLNNVLFDLSKDGEAIIFGEIATKIFDSQPPKEHKKFENWNANVHSYLAMAYDRRYHLKMAQRHYVRALDYSKRGSGVTNSWRKLLEKSLTMCEKRIDLDSERLMATNPPNGKATLKSR